MGFETLDYIVFGIYCLVILSIGLFISRGKKGQHRTSNDYFLAGNSLSWWAIGASLIAANISAEHFIGMSGSGFAVGLGIAAYEWLAAITLILVAKFLLPQMIHKKIYTIPQLAKERYGKGVSFFFSFFWLLVYIFVNLTSVAWLGALAMDQILGWPVQYGVPGLLIFAGLYSIYGGLKAVAWTDVIQVIFLVGGGLITAYFALDAVSGDAGGAVDGFMIVLNKVQEDSTDLHFSMILQEGISIIPTGKVYGQGAVLTEAVMVSKDVILQEGTVITNELLSKFGIVAENGENIIKGMKDPFVDLPGLAVIFGAMWLTNLGYWGFNQYIIQKGLAAKNLKEAKRGLIFAGFLKILIPIIVVVPGITAYVMFNHPDLSHSIEGLAGTIDKADEAYPWLLRNFAPVGIRGLAFAALIAAVVSSLASMLNSTSTIFTLDIYKDIIKPAATERQMVRVGRVSAFVALVIAVFAAKPLLGGLDQAFQYIQEYTGFIYPGVVVVFGMGILWKRATNRAALWTTIATLPTGILMKILLPDLPFIIRMGYVCMVLITLAIVLTLTDGNKVPAEEQSPKNKKTLMNAAYGFGFGAVVTLVLGLLFGTDLFGMSMRDIGFHSIFMMTFLLGFLSIIMYTNAKSPVKDAKSYSFEPEIFKTDKTFFIGAMGIVLIIVTLYAFFWM